MTALTEREPPISTTDALQRTAELLGGDHVFHHSLATALDVHEMLLQGLPGKSLKFLIDNLLVLTWSHSLEKAIGISLRTYQRHKEAPAKLLDLERSGRAWKFTEILVKAIEIFGSQEDAEKWLDRPALGLNQNRPIDLLSTPAGVELVDEFLERLKYGVYA